MCFFFSSWFPCSTKNERKTSGRHFFGFLEGLADSRMELIESRWEGAQRETRSSVYPFWTYIRIKHVGVYSITPFSWIYYFRFSLNNCFSTAAIYYLLVWIKYSPVFICLRYSKNVILVFLMTGFWSYVDFLLWTKIVKRHIWIIS